MFAAALSVAISAALSTSAATRADRVATQALTAELEKVAAIDYASLLTNTFTAPDACPDAAAGSGVASTSCVPVAGRTLRITYSYQSTGADGPVTCNATSPATSARTDGYVELCATTGSVPGAAPQVTRRINAPVAGFSPGEGSVRVTLTGDYHHLPGPVFLLPVAAPDAPVTSGTPDAHGVVLLHAAANRCTTTAPCMLGLTPTTEPASAAGYGLVHSTATGPGAQLALTTGRLAEASATVTKLGSASVQLWATNDDGGHAATNPVAGSVCLWAKFVDNGAEQVVPMCNSGADPGSITLTSYKPTWSQQDGSGLTLPLPTDTPISLTTDAPDGACRHAPGMLGSVPAAGSGADHPAGWLPAAVCTSWTWGQPATWAAAGTAPGPATDISVTLHPGADDTYRLTWSGPAARPAGGVGTDPTWAKPREAVGCAFDGTCRSQADSDVPESTECPTDMPYCLSGADTAPQLTDPVSGAVQLAADGTTSFPLAFRDLDRNPITATVTRLPADGVLATADGPVSVGSSLLDGADSPASVTMSYTPAAGSSGLRSFTVAVRDSHGATRTVDIGLSHAVLGWTVTGADITAAQGATAVPVSVTVTGTDGKPRAGAAVTFTAPDAGITFADATATTGTDGVATTAASFGAAPAGAHPITATVGESGRTGTVTAVVTPTVGDLTLEATGGPQGGRGTVLVTARDQAGAPFRGAPVTVVALAGTAASDHVYPDFAGCVTGADGTCGVSLVIEGTATAGGYTVRGTSGPLVANAAVLVRSVPTQLAVTGGGTVTQGGTSELTGVLRDGAGDPLPSTSLTPGTAGGGVALAPASVTTGPTGTFTFTVSAATSAVTGTRPITVTAAGQALTVPLTVAGAPAALTAAPVTLAQGGTGSLQVTVADGTGAPLPSAGVSFTAAAGGLSVSSHASTDARGTATGILTVAPTTPAGSYPVTVTSGSATITADVIVTATPASVSITGAAQQGGSAQLTVTVLDGAGRPIVGSRVAVAGLPGTLTVSPAAVTTGTGGRAALMITDNGPTTAGIRTVTVTADGVSLPAVIPVVAAAGSLSPDAGAITVARGGQMTLAVTVRDQLGAALPGVPVGVAGLPDGVTATIAVTDASGIARITLNADVSAAAGADTAQLSSGTITRTFTFTVE